MATHPFSLGEPLPVDFLINAPNDKGDIVHLVDIDSLILQEAAKGHTSIPPVLQNDPEFQRLCIVYYIDMRSSVAVVAKVGAAVDRSELAAARKTMFDAIMVQAMRLALEQSIANKPFQPLWLEVFVNRYRDYMPPSLQPLLETVTLKVVHDGYLTARVNKQREIVLSSKLKPFLTTWNTLLLTNGNDEVGEGVFKAALAYCLQPETGFPLMRLPVVGAPDSIVFHQVRKLTTAQIQFLLLHELAHAYYDHNAITQPLPKVDEPALLQLFSSAPYPLYQEHEADAFALREVLRSLPADMDGMTDLYLVAVEFLFSYIICMEATAHKRRVMRNPDTKKLGGEFTERLHVLRTLEKGYGWYSTSGKREAKIQEYTAMAERFTAEYLRLLDGMPPQQLSAEIQHRHGG